MAEMIAYHNGIHKFILWPVEYMTKWYIEITNVRGETIHTTETKPTKRAAILTAKEYCKRLDC
jgi:hypothetical protein